MDSIGELESAGGLKRVIRQTKLVEPLKLNEQFDRVDMPIDRHESTDLMEQKIANSLKFWEITTEIRV